jgi:hypothetical protein
MKKILLLACVSVIAFSSVSAQESLSAGKLMFQTNVTDLNVTFVDDFSIALGVRGGYFVADKLPILAEIGVGYADPITAFNAKLGLGYYFYDGLYLNALGSLRYLSIEDGDSDTLFGLTGELGYAIFLNDHIAIDPKLYLDVPFKDGLKATFGLGCGFTIFF